MPVIVGADPELFLEDSTGKVISVIGKIGGTKDKPKPVKILGKGFAVQEDNVLIEYNIPAAKYAATWIAHHRNMLEYLRKLVGDLGLSLSTKASHSMDPDQLDNPKAWIFGCEPDFDAWGMKWNKKPESIDENFRSAGGHVHIGYDSPNPAMSIKIARMCDMLIGAPLALKDPDKKRAQFYGRPGAMRFKPYGLEYRTPSNYWLQNEANIAEVYRMATKAVQLADVQFDNWEPLARGAVPFITGGEGDTNAGFNIIGTEYV